MSKKKETSISELIIFGSMQLLISVILLFNGFTYITDHFVNDGQIENGSTKQKGLLAFMSLLEKGWWKYLIVLIFGTIGFLMLKEARNKLSKSSKSNNLNPKTKINNLPKEKFMTVDIESQKEGYKEIVRLCSSNTNREELINFIESLKNYNGDKNYYNTLNYVMEHFDNNSIHLIMALDWKQEITDLKWRIESALKSNFRVTADLPDPSKYGEDKAVSDKNVFIDYNNSINREGFELSFVDTDSDEYVIIVNKLQDSTKIATAIDKIGYERLSADSHKINGAK
ncbi:hypothetical protein QYS49_27490 [Marivirga salinae]|uniref:DUF6630 domain-containing protein n=1 Tax=Marivirga salinarum TaxID=3059078 RepID=A0AA49J8L0_9BACT|nr:hypothetical protein [Marivirga sp. BDSF4-3]WKK75271.2 hypothetical protein QYS49_27490 [Marivirga sp. BDSF4-3]